MKNIFVLLCIAIVTQSCSERFKKTELTTSENEYIVPRDERFYDIIKEEDSYTLEDLSNYYAQVKETKSGEKYYNNLRKIMIYHMYKDKNTVNQFIADKELLAYFVEEMISMPYVSDMSVFSGMLGNLYNHWSDAKIGQTAKMILERNIEYINENFDEPEIILAKEHQARGIKKLNEMQLLLVR